MIRVGFIGAVSKEWMGGLNYFKNLLYAISTLEKNELEIFVFVGKKTDTEIKTMFQKYATLIEDSIFDRKSLKWLCYKLENKLFKTNYFLERLLRKSNIEVLSHASVTNLNFVKIINWIPDFQHLHLPDMFSEEELASRNKDFMNLIKSSNKIVLSSYDAKQDFKIFAPKHINKAAVLQFVSQPDDRYAKLTENDKDILLNKYNIKQKNFFYLPNQFWKHKNHMLVFESIKLSVSINSDICVVCTGYLDDYRNKDYLNDINNFIKTNKLEENIKLLGLVDYEDVFGLIKFSSAVINPSLFEGWSSTVEECKSVNKNMILSNLSVHREQYPEATFFERNDIEELSDVLVSYKIPKVKEIESVEVRSIIFAQNYVDIVKEVLNVK